MSTCSVPEQEVQEEKLFANELQRVLDKTKETGTSVVSFRGRRGHRGGHRIVIPSGFKCWQDKRDGYQRGELQEVRPQGGGAFCHGTF